MYGYFAYCLEGTLKSGAQSFRYVNCDCKGRIHVDGDVITLREQPCTSNSVTAWNRALQRTVGYVHPTVYKLIEALHLEQSNTENSVVCLQAGQRAPAAYATCRQKELRLQTVVGSFSEEQITDHVRSIAHNCEFSV